MVKKIFAVSGRTIAGTRRSAASETTSAGAMGGRRR